MYFLVYYMGKEEFYNEQKFYNEKGCILKPESSNGEVVYHSIGGGDAAIRDIIKNGLKSLREQNRVTRSFVDLGTKYDSSIFFRPHKPSDDKNFIGIKVNTQAKVAHQEYRVSQEPSKYRYWARTLEEFQKINVEHYQYVTNRLQLKYWTNYDKDDYIPEVVIGETNIKPEYFAYMSPNLIEIMKEMYKSGEIDASNPLVKRFAPELLEQKPVLSMENLPTNVATNQIPNKDSNNQTPQTPKPPQPQLSK